MSQLFSGSHSLLADYFGGTTHWVIPEFQRDFAWGPENVLQLIKDLQDGICRLNKFESDAQREEKGSKFLGCVIQWERAAIPGEDFAVVPGLGYMSRVKELIDGQQRTSTITLIMCELYAEIKSLSSQLDQSIPDEKELNDFINRKVLQDWLLSRFSRAGSTGAVPKRRATIIRQGTDKWTHNSQTEYRSPVANYLGKTIAAILTPGMALPVVSNADDVNDVLELIREQFALMRSQPLDVLTSHYSQSQLYEELYTGINPIDIETYLQSQPINAELIRKLTAFVGFTHYLLHYCAFTVIDAPNENIALDMFQSLNSTGVQLTAVQLLKPRVSYSFRSAGYLFSADSTFVKFESVNEWLGSGRNAASKKTQFFLKFGLGFFGEEPVNSLSGQRSWLLKVFNAYSNHGVNLAKTKEFVERMYYCCEYIKLFYLVPREDLFKSTAAVTPGTRSTFDRFKLTHDRSQSSYMLTDATSVALMFLIDAKHDLAHTILGNFYVRFQEAPIAFAATAKLEFERTVLVLAAFFLLWRGVLGTKYPDDVYRIVMKSRHFTSAIPVKTASGLGRTLAREARRTFKAKGISRSTLSKHFAKGLRYTSGVQSILRFVLMLAAHKKVPLVSVVGGSLSAHGLVKADPNGPDYLFPDRWIGPDCKSIEHVAPQKLLDLYGTAPPNWDVSLVNASDLIHSLGNLTLLSMPMNSAVPEDTSRKKLYYEGLISPGVPAGVTPTAAALMAMSPMQAHLVPVYLRLHHWVSDITISPGVSSGNEWGPTFIQERSENLGKVVLDDLFLWLRGK